MTLPHLPEKVTWLTLARAAAELDVHPTTLRRWADHGEIPHMLTPGGHRRFAASDLQRFAAERRRLRLIGNLEQMWAEQALTQTRQELGGQKDQHWLAVQDADTREHNRHLGRRLMGLTLQYLSAAEENTAILDEARLIGQAYGASASAAGLPLTEALQAAMFFRDTLVEVALHLPETAHIEPEANLRLMRRITRLLNVVHLAIAECFDKIV